MTCGVSGDKPKLLVVLAADAIGGAETRSYLLLEGLRGFECSLLTQAAIAGFYRNLGIKTQVFDDHGCSAPYRLAPGNILRYAWAIRAVVRRERPDLLLALMHNGTLFASVASRLFRLKPPLVGTILGNVSAYFAHAGRAPSRLERWILKTCVNVPTGVIAPSRGVIDDLVENHGAASGKLELIYNGVDIARVRALSREPVTGLVKDRPWIVTACRLNGQKDFPGLLSAFKAVRLKHDLKLILVGDGELRPDIQRMAADLGIGDDVVLAGFQENPYPYMAKADVFVLSSFYEGFGNVIVEAMALGIPVIASDCPSGPGEIIRDGENGFLVPVGDWRTMAERCLRVLEDAESRTRLIAAGLERAEKFGVEAMVSGFDHYLMDALAECFDRSDLS